MKNKFKIDGMHCASCAVNIEGDLKKLPGVNGAAVNYALKTAQVDFDETKVGHDDFKKTVEGLGYSIEEHTAPMAGMHHGAQGNGSEHDHVTIDNSKDLAQAKKRFIIALIFTLPFLPTMLGYTYPGNFGLISLSDFIQLVCGTIVVFGPGMYFHRDAWIGLKHFRATMNSLISVGTLSAYSLSLYQIFVANAMPYLETAAFITMFILLGKLLEEKTKGQASQAIQKLLELGAKEAIVIRDGKEITIPAEQLQANDVVVVKPGAKIPTDGVVLRGESHVDESMLTGESKPVKKEIGSEVFGATINKNGVLQISVTKVGANTVLAQIIKLVEEAQMYKAPIQKLTDKIAGIFTPTVIILAILTFAGALFFGQEFIPSMIRAVAVLVIACPCAMGLATPTAVMVGTGKAANQGIIIKNGEALERVHAIDTVLLDKTGTLTKGQPEVTDILGDQLTMGLAASLEKNSDHPIAQSIVKSYTGKIEAVDQFKTIEGVGVQGKINNQDILIANPAYVQKLNINFDPAPIVNLQKQGKTVVIVLKDNHYLGAIAVADQIKEESKLAVKRLHDLKMTVGMVTGDHGIVAEYIAKQLGIDNIYAEVMPQDKASIVKELQLKGKKVAFVGDGINDAPALAQADLGIAIGTGTDVAIETGQIVLVQGNPLKVPEAIIISRQTFSAIKQNLFWAFFYNIVAIPFAIAGLLNPIIAAAAMGLSSVSVVGNSLRIKLKK